MVLLAVIAAWQISTRAATPPTTGLILIDDVERFYRVYDAAQSSPTAERLQTGYIDPGTDGLHQFAKLRDLTGATLAAAVDRGVAATRQLAKRQLTWLRSDDSIRVVDPLAPCAFESWSLEVGVALSGFIR